MCALPGEAPRGPGFPGAGEQGDADEQPHLQSDGDGRPYEVPARGDQRDEVRKQRDQLEAGEPPFVQAVLNKLTLVGYAREEVVHLMALVLAEEIDNMLREDRPFDTARYEVNLRALPELPEEN